MEKITSTRIRNRMGWPVGALFVSLSLGLSVGPEFAAGQGGLKTQSQITPAAIPKCTTISAISGSVARTTDPSNNQGIQFKIPTPALNRPLAGQTVCLHQRESKSTPGPSRAKNRAVWVAWPAEAHKKNDVSVGHMETWVKLSNTGRIDGTTRTWTNNAARGFTGGVKVQLQDRSGNVLQWDMPVQKYGVNAKNPISQAGSPSSRKVDWSFPVPAAILNSAARIRIIHRHTPEGRWDQSIEMAKELGEVLKTYAEVYETVAGAGGGGPTGSGPTQPPVR